MTRVYKRKIGVGLYKYNSGATLAEAVGEVWSKMSVRDAGGVLT
jgi:hypothetical protein